VWRKAGCFRPARGSAHGWILGIVRHRAIDALRRRQTHARRRAELDTAGAHLEAPERTEAEVERRENERDLHSALHRLPSEQRHTIELAYFAGCSQSEISDRLLVPLGTVKSRMRLGLERLRTTLPHATA
jgi:RNA polymerase sigma-70 factor (ECF subfamily)